ncbi:NADPH-dependent assimilatory sulfite reductase hemoprotein subunit [Zhongshania marina]|uniref:NADPH-dependent assimilatory sulfite reductase hemoprotein subunit n=1 Tax=Zhongshania marina TaxID=2304603 RepID=A0A2S4HE59_9GAMM|nr:NADPH-dependent assimilatory sulfite reductase hemoprotein subunit [Marortus luteolus]POP52276.1 NADPH-dependent assimilatory sulfite reductase hemoprotein subunit [Marortus luteolus]
MYLNTKLPSQPIDNLHENEKLKATSRHLRGNISNGLDNPITGAVPGDDHLLMKFHGVYQQDDRDLRNERRQRYLEKLYQFMVRLRIPGGVLTKDQWHGLDILSRRFAERGIRITTRQTIQFHGIRKRKLRALMQGIHNLGLDTIAACGDDNRGVVCGANPCLSALNKQVSELAKETSNRLIPKTGAYSEIWYQKPTVKTDNEEPIYGDLYLPRKFKVGYAIPPINDIDVYGQDVGYIAIIENGALTGFNVCVGGGMGQLDARTDSYPRLADLIGFIEADKAPRLAETIMTIQRDFGDRIDRHRARFKYTLDRLGLDWFNNELTARFGETLGLPRPFKFEQNGDKLGWHQADDGLWHTTIYIENGRIDGALRDQLSGFFQFYGGRIRLTTNQNLQLTHIADYEKSQIQSRLDDLDLLWRLTPHHQANHLISCVALPTCGLAMAEAERYMPRLLDLFERLKARHGVNDIPITIRLTGCPNGCARPYLGEIALTGRAPGLYNLYLGGSFHGDRLATLYASNIDEETFSILLSPLLEHYSNERLTNEHFGDFLVRQNLLDSQCTSVNLGTPNV